MREVEEESGLTCIVPVDGQIFDIDVHRIPARGDEPEHDHWDIRYAMQATVDQTYTVSDESHDLAWVEILAIGAYTDEESTLRMGRKWTERAADGISLNASG